MWGKYSRQFEIREPDNYIRVQKENKQFACWKPWNQICAIPIMWRVSTTRNFVPQAENTIKTTFHSSDRNFLGPNTSNSRTESECTRVCCMRLFESWGPMPAHTRETIWLSKSWKQFYVGSIPANSIAQYLDKYDQLIYTYNVFTVLTKLHLLFNPTFTGSGWKKVQHYDANEWK